MIQRFCFILLLGYCNITKAQSSNETLSIPDSCFSVTTASFFADNSTECIGTYYGVEMICPIQAYEFLVFNRWGELLFETNNVGKFWDAGLVKGGAYYWFVSGEMENSSGVIQNVKTQGVFEVIR